MYIIITTINKYQTWNTFYFYHNDLSFINEQDSRMISFVFSSIEETFSLELDD